MISNQKTSKTTRCRQNFSTLECNFPSLFVLFSVLITYLFLVGAWQSMQSLSRENGALCCTHIDIILFHCFYGNSKVTNSYSDKSLKYKRRNFSAIFQENLLIDKYSDNIRLLKNRIRSYLCQTKYQGLWCHVRIPMLIKKHSKFILSSVDVRYHIIILFVL